MSAVREVERRRRVIDSVLARARALAGQPDADALQADYARYVCVLASGFIERAIAELIIAYVEGKAPRQIRSYLEASLSRLTNVDKERLLRVIGALDAGWRNEMDLYVVDRRLEALNSVIGLRHDIAHGGGGSLSLHGMETYWKSVQEIIDKLEELLFSNPRPVRPKKKK